MIHAMMSEAGSGGRERSHVVSTFGALADDQRRAESEARRVMAEAEPGDGRRVPAFRVEWGAAPTWARADASLDAGAPYFLALAESLASFLAAPDPAAYLAELVTR